MDKKEVGGIVLAAGRSTRMGRPKALLEAGGESFLKLAMRALRDGGCEAIVVVVGYGDETAANARDAGAVVVRNREIDSEQIDSLRMGLEALPDRVGAAVVLPVDHPLVRGTTVAALVRRWREAPERIVRPIHAGRPGHPTVFPRSVWSELAGDLPRGARSLVEDEAHPTLDVPVEDTGVIADIDTPEAYARWVEGA